MIIRASDCESWVAQEGGTLTIFVGAPPVPASRARVTRWGTYYTEAYNDYRNLHRELVPEADLTGLPYCWEGPLVVRLEFHVVRPPTTKRHSPNGDIDNYIKAILDILTQKKYWKDDREITRLVAVKRFADRPSTVVNIRDDHGTEETA